MLDAGGAAPVFVTSDANGGWSNGGYYAPVGTCSTASLEISAKDGTRWNASLPRPQQQAEHRQM
jgi:hypothetical protein